MNNQQQQGAALCSSLAGGIFVCLAAIGFSVKAVLVKLAYDYDVDAVSLLALRMAFSLPFFVLMLFAPQSGGGGDKPRFGEYLHMFGLGLLGYYLASYLDFLGLQYISAGLERMILFLYPTLVIVLSAIFLRRRISGREGVALILSYIGIGAVFFQQIVLDYSMQQERILGVVLVFISAVSYAVYLMGSGRLIVRFGATRFTAWAMITASIASLAQFAFDKEPGLPGFAAPVYGLALIMALVSTVFPSWLLAHGLKRIGASRSAMLGSIGPVSTCILAYFILDETLDLLQIAGFLLVLAGVLVVSVKSSASNPR
ncbi:DMT family transporter [Candidatus Methylospira mobilis]|uniref:DMT family transporter n=1 Tax=Candidatus Methylospira mobilis TaxID=1808979 RepID=A0A5Q0BL31_9GAMM|nr:DMT family transporter [Candidatus Methylospira mobilis]QFY42828.1 DMT family transporter [Candidatus Methylospira mobilis]WNV03720.1 DMT family transporter [Candidatus Methylospira mobilis]